jgi:hypothetical protein
MITPLARDTQTAPVDAIEAVLWAYDNGYTDERTTFNEIRSIIIEYRI